MTLNSFLDFLLFPFKNSENTVTSQNLFIGRFGCGLGQIWLEPVEFGKRLGRFWSGVSISCAHSKSAVTTQDQCMRLSQIYSEKQNINLNLKVLSCSNYSNLDVLVQPKN